MGSSGEIAEIVNRFAVVAEQFCSVLDGAPSLTRIELLTAVYTAIPKLIDQAINMPDVEPNECDGEEADVGIREGTRLGHDDWQRLYSVLKEKLGDWDSYQQVFNPVIDNESIGGSLADDLADIYRDLKDVLVKRKASALRSEDSIWDWRFSFRSHWGKHAIDALKVIHSRLHYN